MNFNANLVKCTPLLILIWLFGLGFTVTSCTVKEQPKDTSTMTDGNATAETAKGYWTCPMHPQVHNHEAGKCPMCGMPLVKVDGKDASNKAKTPFIPASDSQLENANITKYKVIRKDITMTVPVVGRLISAKQVAFYIYEFDLSFIEVGHSFSGSVATSSDEHLTGKIVHIDRILDPASRTVRVIGTLSTAVTSYLADASFNGSLAETFSNRLAIPIEAVLYTGTKNLVYVFTEENKLEPRSVVLGAKSNKDYQVLSGLKEGEIISGSANFLIDSEAKIRGM